MEMVDYMNDLDELLGVAVGLPTSVDVDTSEVAERLAMTVYAVGTQMGWNVGMHLDDDGDLCADIYYEIYEE